MNKTKHTKSHNNNLEFHCSGDVNIHAHVYPLQMLILNWMLDATFQTAYKIRQSCQRIAHLPTDRYVCTVTVYQHTNVRVCVNANELFIVYIWTCMTVNWPNVKIEYDDHLAYERIFPLDYFASRSE